MKKNSNELVKNRSAYHNFEILETLEAGIALMGTEVKSLRNHGGNLNEAYVIISKNEAFLKGASISPYSHGNIHNHEEKRLRKLLLHRREIDKLKKNLEIKGNTIVPLSFYLKKGKIKLSIAIARGKKLYDKREALKKKDQSRAIEKALKESS